MLQGVTESAAFVLLLSRCVLSREFCQLEIRRALELRKPVVLVRETDPRHGAAEPLPTNHGGGGGGSAEGEAAAVTVRCAHPGCGQAAAFGAPGAAWPSACEAHAGGGSSAAAAAAPMVPVSLSLARVSGDLLNYSLIFDELRAGRLVADPTALELGSRLLFPIGGGGAGVAATAVTKGEQERANVVAEVSWFSEAEFRAVSLSKLLVALGMQQRQQQRQMATAAAEVSGDADGDAAAAAALRAAFRKFACGCRAPPLPPWARFHACLLHDPAVPTAAAAMRSLASALEGAFEGLRVAVVTAADGAEATERTALSSRSVLVLLTRGLLSDASSPAVAALAAVLSARGPTKPRVVMAHESSPSRGGAASFADYVAEARRCAASSPGGAADQLPRLFLEATSVPWHTDPEFAAAAGLKMLLDGLAVAEEEEDGGESGDAASEHAR